MLLNTGADIQNSGNRYKVIKKLSEGIAVCNIETDIMFYPYSGIVCQPKNNIVHIVYMCNVCVYLCSII